MQDRRTVNADDRAIRSTSYRTGVIRRVAVLALATLALAVFICALGDFRRRRNAVAQTQWYADAFAQRMGEAGVLPLNLAVSVVPQHQSKIIPLEHLSREEARYLRNSDRRVIVAHTIPLVQVLGSNGRAVVFFQAGKFDVDWVALAEFNRLYEDQTREVDRLAGAETAGENASQP